MTLPAYVSSETWAPADHGGPPASVFLVKAGAGWPSRTQARAGPHVASSQSAAAIAILRAIEVLPFQRPGPRAIERDAKALRHSSPAARGAAAGSGCGAGAA